jgi:hypothetical protein
MPDLVNPFMEQLEAGESIGPVGSVRVYMVSELKEMGYGVMVCASKEERKGTQ